MSFFARLADRGGFAAPGAAAPVMTPKGRGIRRAAAPEGEEMQPVRILSREETEEEAQPARIARQEEEEEAQPTRVVRQEEEEEAAQPLRRQPDEEGEEAVMTVRRARLRRAERPDEPELDPKTALPDATPMDEPEPSDLRATRAVRRSGAPLPAAAAPSPPPGPPLAGETLGDAPAFAPPPAVFSAPPGAAQEGRLGRPIVVIDQVDVLIHEPAAPSSARAPGASRTMRARYLRRL